MLTEYFRIDSITKKVWKYCVMWQFTKISTITLAYQKYIRCLNMYPNILNFYHSILLQASELFFASRKLTAGEALRLGLVTRTLWPDKFQDELISVLKAVSNQSLQVRKCCFIFFSNTWVIL